MRAPLRAWSARTCAGVLACIAGVTSACSSDAQTPDGGAPDGGTSLVACDPAPLASGACASNIQYSTVNPGLRLDFYKPAGAGRGYPLLLIHGGGWRSGDKNDLSREARYLSAAGFAVFSINYRLHGACGPRNPDAQSTMSSMLLDSAAGCPPGTQVDTVSHVWHLTRPPMMEDVAAALSWVREHGRAYFASYNPSDGLTHAIGALGSSAGGHLALLSAVYPTVAVKPVAVAALSGPADFEFCGTVNSFTALDGEAATTGPGGNTCGYAGSMNLTGGDYTSLPAVWQDASPLWQLIHNAPTTPAQFWLLNGTGAVVPGEFIPGQDAVSFAAAFGPLGLTAQVRRYYSDADLHAASNWGHHLNGTTTLVEESIRDFFVAQLPGFAEAAGDTLQ